MERREVLKQSLPAKALCVSLQCLLLAVPSFPQTPTHNHVAPPTVRGDEHPEQVSDQRAWLMQLIASTSSDTDDELTKKHALIHRQTVGLNGVDAALGDFRVKFDHLISNYNNTVSAPPATGTTAYQQQAQDQLYRDIDQLVTGTVSFLHRNLSEEEWRAIAGQVRESKAKIAFASENPAAMSPAALTPLVFHPGSGGKLLRTQQADFNSASYEGYTQYTALESDGTYWYQTVYAYGSSSISWSCTWTQVGQYNWAYEPPGCPAQHTLTITNQVDGQGPVNLDKGTYSPANYINVSHSIQVPVGKNDGSEKSLSGAKILCTVAGVFFTFVLETYIAIATTNYILTTKEGTECVYYLYCPNGNAAVTCPSSNPVYVDGTQNACLNYLYDKRIRLNYNGTNHCFPVGKATLTTVAHNCS